MLKVLVLGGSTLARELINRLTEIKLIHTTVCLTKPSVEYGAAKNQLIGLLSMKTLCDLIENQGVDLLVDATHAYAVEISKIAKSVADGQRIPILTLQEKPWDAQAGDNWQYFEAHAEVMRFLSTVPSISHVFLSVGGRQIPLYLNNEQLQYTARCIETTVDDSLQNVRIIREKGPFDIEHERRLFAQNKFNYLVTKNSGGQATYSKLIVAREYNVSVLMISRVSYQKGKLFSNVDLLINYLVSNFNVQ